MPLLGHQGTLWCPVGCLCLKGGFRKRGLRPPGWEGPWPGPSSVPRCLEPDSDCRGHCLDQGHPERRQRPLLPSSCLCQVHRQNTGPCSAQLFREPFRGKKMGLKIQTWVLGFSDLTTGPRRAPGQRWGLRETWSHLPCPQAGISHAPRPLPAHSLLRKSTQNTGFIFFILIGRNYRTIL